VGSKISLHGLQTQELNEKNGTVTGPAVNNRIGIQLEEGNKRVSIRIINILYQEGPDRNRLILYSNLVDKAQAKITLLKEGLGLQIQTRTMGNETYQYGTHALEEEMLFIGIQMEGQV